MNDSPPIPLIADFPPAPPGKHGWPWDTPAVNTALAGRFPLITVITPSFNQGCFIEETIRSVLLQGYPALEYIVMDGGSTDNTCSILEKYSPWLTHWESEPDRGQPHAINKGLQLAKGTLFIFLNSDDLLLPDALHFAGERHLRSPGSIIAGDVLEFRDQTIIRTVQPIGLSYDTFIRVWKHPQWHQPGIFIPTELVSTVGPFDETKQYGFDYAFMCRALRASTVDPIHRPTAMFRLHDHSKTGTNDDLIEREQLHASKHYWSEFSKDDRRAFQTYASKRLFLSGLIRVLKGRKLGLKILLEGFAFEPISAITYSFIRAYQWCKYRLFS